MKNERIAARKPAPLHPQIKVIGCAFQARQELFGKTAVYFDNGKDFAKTPKL